MRGVLERQRLRDELAEDDLGDGQHQQHERGGGGLRGNVWSPPTVGRTSGVSQTAIVRCAYAPSTRLDSVMPIWQAAM